MADDPSYEEIRRLSLVSSVVFLVVFISLLVGWFLPGKLLSSVAKVALVPILLVSPLGVAICCVAKLSFLRLRSGAKIPFVDGWLIQLSIIGLYAVPFI